MSAYQDPAALRRRLQRELRRYRSAAGQTQAAVARVMDWSPSKVIRIESGAVAVATNDLKVLLAYYGVTDPNVLDELITLSKNSKLPSRWNQYQIDGAISQESATYFGHEASAAIIRQFELSLFPGLLQTEEYMRALLTGFGRSGADLEGAVEARLLRQEIFEREGAPSLFVILDEKVLRQQVGGAKTMKHQFERLEELDARPNVTIQVVRFSVGSYPGLLGPFTLLEFTDDDPVLYLESRYETVTREDSDEVGQYLDSFQHMERDVATAPTELAALLQSIALEPA
jgi:transcriptional regulator with XRE-family HTH domain